MTVPLPSNANQLDLMDEAMEELALENTGSKATDKTYRPAKEKRRSPSAKKRHHKKTLLDDKGQLTNPNLKSIKVPVVFSDSEDDSLGSKPSAGRHKLPMSPGRSSISSNMTSEESEDDFLILDMPTSSKMVCTCYVHTGMGSIIHLWTVTVKLGPNMISIFWFIH